MRRTLALLTIPLAGAILVACAGASNLDGEDSDPDVVDSDTTYVPDDTGFDTGGDSDGPAGFVVTFDEERYQVDELEVLRTGGVDMTGDGVVDNKVGTLLGALAGIRSLGISLDTTNQNIQYLLDTEGVIVLMHAYRKQERDVTLDLVLGQRDITLGLVGLPDQYGDDGEPTQRLRGRFTAEDHFATNGGAISLPFQFSAFEPTILVSAEQVRSEVDVLSANLEGYLAGAFPVDSVMKDIIEPLLIDYYGSEEAAAGMLDTVRALVVSAADIDIDTPDPKLSGAFRFKAHAEVWTDPE